MSQLVLVLPTRPRTDGGEPPVADAAAAGEDFFYVLSPDGLSVSASGRAPAALLPRADSVVVVVAPSDVAWHRVALPKVGANQMRAALVGILEDQLLADSDDLHFAVAPKPVSAGPTWVAALDRRWLARWLAQLEAAGLFAERVVPAAVPTQSDDEPATGHFFAADGGGGAAVGLSLADAQGVLCLTLNGVLARALASRWAQQTVRWTATPTVALQAEQWLGAPVTVVSDAESALAAQRSRWNLRQFDLSARHRGSRALRDWWSEFRGPRWRSVRWGAAVLVAVQVVGLNAWAWHQRQTVAGLKRGIDALFLATFPKVRDVLDAPLQMRSQTDALRNAAGLVGDADLEPQLAAVASAWPDGRAPAESIRFDAGHLILPLANWTAAQRAQFESRLRAAGWTLRDRDGQATLERSGAAS
jgi:general secretion pathway protein L